MAAAHHPKAALLASTVTLLATMGAIRAQEAPLDGPAAWHRLVGNTAVVTTKGGGYTEYYESGGAVRRMDADGATTGQWSEEGDKTCFDYPDDDDRVCVRVTLRGASGTFTDGDGTMDSFVLLPGNPKNL